MECKRKLDKVIVFVDEEVQCRHKIKLTVRNRPLNQGIDVRIEENELAYIHNLR